MSGAVEGAAPVCWRFEYRDSADKPWRWHYSNTRVTVCAANFEYVRNPMPLFAALTTPPARSYADGVEDAAKVAEVERDKSAVAVEDLKRDEGAQSVAAGGYLSSKRIAAAIRLLSQGGKA